jgi:hypothetical protein
LFCVTRARVNSLNSPGSLGRGLNPLGEANFIKCTTAASTDNMQFSFGAKKKKGGKRQSIFGLAYDLRYFFDDAFVCSVHSMHGG